MSQEFQRFNDPAAVARFMNTRIDHPCEEAQMAVSPGITLSTRPYELEDDQFTNIYRISTTPPSLDMDVRVSPQPAGVNEALEKHERVAASAGFFFLADVASQVPKQAALHGAIANHLIYGLPLVDRELLELRGNNTVSARAAKALGNLSVGGEELVWAGSLTDHDHEVTVYGGGNARISHQETDRGLVRVLEESSKFTSKIKGNQADAGCTLDPHTGNFIVTHTSGGGKMNIFDHDLTLRLPKKLAKRGTAIEVTSLDQTPITELRGAISVGPSLLGEQSYADHPINSDLSLGTMPPFIRRRMARMAIFATPDGLTHLQLFDARPGSHRFVGVTPDEAHDAIMQEFGQLAWGCLDPGQTARLVARDGSDVQTFGNRHYLDKPLSVPRAVDMAAANWSPHRQRTCDTIGWMTAYVNRARFPEALPTVKTAYCWGCDAPGPHRISLPSGQAAYACKACGQHFERSYIWDPAMVQSFDAHGDLLHDGAGVFITDGQGNVLLFQRTKFPFLLTIPAGHRDTGEDPLTCALRETLRENGISLKPSDVQLVFDAPIYGDSCVGGADIHHWHAYQAVVDPTTVQAEIDADEGSDWQWHPIDSLNEENTYVSGGVYD